MINPSCPTDTRCSMSLVFLSIIDVRFFFLRFPTRRCRCIPFLLSASSSFLSTIASDHSISYFFTIHVSHPYGNMFQIYVFKKFFLLYMLKFLFFNSNYFLLLRLFSLRWIPLLIYLVSSMVQKINFYSINCCIFYSDVLSWLRFCFLRVNF